MPRTLTKNANGDLEFVESVWDDDGDNITYPLSDVVELDQIDGQKVPSVQRDPSWLLTTTIEYGFVPSNDRWEEDINVTILDPDANLSVADYRFVIKASDGKEETIRYFTLKVR